MVVYAVMAVFTGVVLFGVAILLETGGFFGVVWDDYLLINKRVMSHWDVKAQSNTGG